jgi:O-antigen/teichoic acid export membrane protein
VDETIAAFDVTSPRYRKTVGRFSLYFLPSIFSGALSFLMLPLVTRVAGPREYGIFALVSAYTAFGSALATMGGNYIISHRFLGASEEEQRQVVSTVSLLALATVSTYGILLFSLWRLLPGTEHTPTIGVVLAVLAMIIAQPWVGALDIVTIKGEAGTFAAVAIGQAVVTSVVLLFGLYTLHLGITAFFLSQLAGSVVALSGAFVTLRGLFEWRLDPRVLRELRSLGFISAVGNVAESIQTGVERTTVSLHSGVAQLGIYSNSQSYRTFAAMPVGAISKSVWPVTLREAGDPDSHFARTKEAWDIAYIGLTGAGIFLATVGDLVIAGLTHGKFTEAYRFATFWMMFLLMQNSGKPQTAILFRLGGGRIYARLVVISTFVGMVALVAFVPRFGLWGAVAAATVQQLFLRASIQIGARPLRRTPFQDGWALFGILYIATVYVARLYLGGSPQANAVILAASTLALLFLARKSLLGPVQRVLFSADPVGG